MKKPKRLVEPKPTTLLDVWGTDVDRVILEGGTSLVVKAIDFTPNGEWWFSAISGCWLKSADTRVAYVFPPAFAPSVDKADDRVNFGGAMGLKEEMEKINSAPKPSLSVRLDNWLKKLVCRGA